MKAVFECLKPILTSFFQSNCPDTNNHLYLGTSGKKELSIPWPKLIRYVGSYGSGRAETTHSILIQAIKSGYDVIALFDDHAPPIFSLSGIAKETSRSDSVFVTNMLDCSLESIRETVSSSGIRCFLTSTERMNSDRLTKMHDELLMQLINYVDELPISGNRLVICLNGVLTRTHNRILSDELIQTCAAKLVTLIFNDGISKHDSSSLLRQADCIVVGGACLNEWQHPYILDVLSSSGYPFEDLSHFREGMGIVAYRSFTQPPILLKAELSYAPFRIGTEQEVLAAQMNMVTLTSSPP